MQQRRFSNKEARELKIRLRGSLQNHRKHAIPSADLHYPNDLDGPLNEAATDSITLTLIIVPLTLSVLCLLFLVRQDTTL